jgi:hypothetical protein
MKKLIYIIAAVLTISFANQAQAQVKTEAEVITLTANLNTTLALKMDKSDVTFDFTTLSEYKEGLGGYENASHASTGNVSSTANWRLSFKAQSEMTHKDGDAVMPLDNVGLSAKFTGVNKIKNNAEKAPLALSTKETVILDHNGKNSNAGDTDVNSFTIYWEMGTKNAKMNQESIFTQDLKKGSYSTKVEFIATEVL